MSKPLLTDDRLFKRVMAVNTNDPSDRTECDIETMTAAEVRDFYEAALRPIPCSERMPEVGKLVLAWLIEKGEEGRWEPLLITPPIGKSSPLTWQDDFGDHVCDVDDGSVTHWKEMPPAP